MNSRSIDGVLNLSVTSKEKYPILLVYIRVLYPVLFFNEWKFLAPTGAQEVLILVRPFVRSVQTCLEQSIFIFLGQIALREQ